MDENSIFKIQSANNVGWNLKLNWDFANCNCPLSPTQITQQG